MKNRKLVSGMHSSWKELDGGHDFNIWYLGFYYFVRIFGGGAE